MRFLVDTHILLWAAVSPALLSSPARQILSNPRNELFFSVASLWELAIKRSHGRANFPIGLVVLRNALLQNDYLELPINSDHAMAVEGLPLLHRDPFDRLLIAQALIEQCTLLTADSTVARYPGAIQKV